MNIGLICMIFVLVVAFADYYLKNAKQVDEYVVGIISGKYIKTSIVNSTDDGSVTSYKDIYYLIVQYQENVITSGDPIKETMEDLSKVITGSKLDGSQSGMKKVKELIVSKEIYDKYKVDERIPIAIDKRLKLF